MINEISVKLPSQFLISKTTTYFDENFDLLIMNNKIESEMFKPGSTIEKTINEIKDIHLKSITTAAMNISDITLFDENIEQPSMNSRVEVANFEPEPTFEKNINEIKYNYLKSITSTDTNLSAITSNKPFLSSEHLKYNIMPWILLLSPEKSPQFTKYLSSMHPKGNTELQIQKWWVHNRSALFLFFFRS